MFLEYKPLIERASVTFISYVAYTNVKNMKPYF
jgi:hypothetical protein